MFGPEASVVTHGKENGKPKGKKYIKIIHSCFIPLLIYGMNYYVKTFGYFIYLFISLTTILTLNIYSFAN